MWRICIDEIFIDIFKSEIVVDVFVSQTFIIHHSKPSELIPPYFGSAYNPSILQQTQKSSPYIYSFIPLRLLKHPSDKINI